MKADCSEREVKQLEEEKVKIKSIEIECWESFSMAADLESVWTKLEHKDQLWHWKKKQKNPEELCQELKVQTRKPSFFRCCKKNRGKKEGNEEAEVNTKEKKSQKNKTSLMGLVCGWMTLMGTILLWLSSNCGVNTTVASWVCLPDVVDVEFNYIRSSPSRSGANDRGLRTSPKGKKFRLRMTFTMTLNPDLTQSHNRSSHTLTAEV